MTAQTSAKRHLLNFSTDALDELRSASTWTCGICLQLIEEPVDSPCCGHLFCVSCLRKWFARKSSCPMCRHSKRHRSEPLFPPGWSQSVFLTKLIRNADDAVPRTRAASDPDSSPSSTRQGLRSETCRRCGDALAPGEGADQHDAVCLSRFKARVVTLAGKISYVVEFLTTQPHLLKIVIPCLRELLDRATDKLQTLGPLGALVHIQAQVMLTSNERLQSRAAFLNDVARQVAKDHDSCSCAEIILHETLRHIYRASKRAATRSNEVGPLQRLGSLSRQVIVFDNILRRGLVVPHSPGMTFNDVLRTAVTAKLCTNHAVLYFLETHQVAVPGDVEASPGALFMASLV